MTITVQDDQGLKGWVRRGGREHSTCKQAVREGRPFHAAPAAFGATLTVYHFATIEEATAALKTLPARRLTDT